MTLSNFNQTDKQVQQWFLLLPDGHEGPYSIEQLEQKLKEGLSPDCKVWKQGSEESILIKDLLASDDEMGPPDLPPLPFEINDDLPPDLPVEVEEAEFIPEAPIVPKKSTTVLVRLVLGATILLSLFVGIQYFLESPESVSWSRPQKMTIETQNLLTEKAVLKDWKQDLFFYEGTSPDYSRFWLVTPQFYNCDIEAQFVAEEQDILSLEPIKKISFRSKTRLENHVAEFDKFEFEDWPKLVPGFYKMNLTAKNCEWNSLRSKLANIFNKAPEKVELSYRIGITSQKVEFLSIALKKLAEEKFRMEQRKKLAADQFWQDVQQKYQTLLAVSLQVEQLFLDFVNSNNEWKSSLKLMVDKYTRTFGSLLTNFVVSNEEDFKKLREDKVKDLSVKTAYESRIRGAAKGMGLKSMTLIEEWQKLSSKDARSKKAQNLKKVKDTFSAIKKDIENKIIDVTEEQASLTK